MTDLSLLAVAGCRPNFVKLGPLWKAVRARTSWRTVLVHTGQHYDDRLSQVFFRDLGLPEPDVRLGVGSGSHATQTARIMEGIESTLLAEAPDLVVVVGDVNSTVAAALTAVKLGIPVAHVEAGLRSFDREMPEEVNRVVTDRLSDLLFATETSAVDNLRREGVPGEKVWFVGNVMADALLGNLDRLSPPRLPGGRRLAPRSYGVLTLHRPANVDDPATASDLLSACEAIQRAMPIVFPVHPRTRRRFEERGLRRRLANAPGLVLVPPLGYLDFLGLVRDAAFVMTDSGGLQEETTLLGVPCLTLRDGTERPVTVTAGTNRIVGRDPAAIVAAAHEAIAGRRPGARRPELWDGHAAERIVDVLESEAPRIRGLYPNLRERTPWRSSRALAG